jgi:hypothetical protein
LKIRFVVGWKPAVYTSSSDVPLPGELVSLDGVVRQVGERRWDFFPVSDADAVVTVFLLERPSVRGPKPSVKKAKGKLQ